MYPDLGNLLLGFIFFLSSVICWYFWRISKKYKAFPSPIFDARWVFDILTGRYPKTLSFGSRAFSLSMEVCKHFENEGLCFVWGFQPMLLIFGEEYTKILLNHPSATSRPFHYSLLADGLGKGLTSAALGPTWRKKRKAFNPAFKFDILKLQMNNFNVVARSFVNHLLEAKNRPTSDVISILKLHSLKSIMEALFRLQVNSKQQEQIYLETFQNIDKLIIDAEHRLIRPWLFWKPLSFLLSKDRREAQEAFHNFIKNTAQEIIRSTSSGTKENESEKEPNTHKSFSRILVEYQATDPSFTLRDMEEEIKTFIFAGHDSVSNTMRWCLFMLAIHPEVQERAFEEVKSVVGLNDVDVNYSDLSKLTYCECILKETLRLFPQLPFIGRYTTEEIECGKYKIPKNTALFFNMYLLHRNPNIYPDPEKFDPERFCEKFAKHPWAHVPFAEGIRNCIGKNFAMAQMKTYLVHVLRKVKLTSPDTRESMKMVWKLVLAPTRPIRFNITPRLHEE